jgi:DNA-binding CsgD family transcriptional regulator
MSFQLPNNHYFLSSANELDEILTPLKQFAIHLFTYLRNYNDRSQIYLSSNASWIADYYQLGLYETSLFELSPNQYSDGFILWPDNSPLKVFQHGREFYNSHCGVTYTEKLHNAREFYFFSSSATQQVMQNFFINNLDILKKFILYFRDRASKILLKSEANKIILSQDVRVGHVDLQSITHTPNEIIELKQQKEFFNKKTHLNKYIINTSSLKNIKLTGRELNCLAGLLNNQSCSEIANSYHISKRTVEAHMKSIKAKLNCKKKSEIAIFLKDCALPPF